MQNEHVTSLPRPYFPHLSAELETMNVPLSCESPASSQTFPAPCQALGLLQLTWRGGRGWEIGRVLWEGRPEVRLAGEGVEEEPPPP